MEKMRMASADMTEQHIDKIAELFPNCITETVDSKGKPRKAINFDMLKQMLSDDVPDGDEAYEFTWVGKKAAMVEANKSISKTLRPCPEESEHWDSTENLYIEGDNLEVLNLLRESYLGKVKMIYIDPPYNTGNDFIYKDDFKMSATDYADESGEYDDDGNRLFKNTETNGRFHSDWCSMIYSRLMLARHLLSDDGVIFISIDDNEQANLKKICDEVFGASNFVSKIIIQSNKRGQTYKQLAKTHEYLICYSKTELFELYEFETGGDNLDKQDEFGKFSERELRNRNPKFGRFNRPNLFYPIYIDLDSADDDGYFQVSSKKFPNSDKTFPLDSQGNESCWRWSKEKLYKHSINKTKDIFAKKTKSGEWRIFEKYRKESVKAKTIWQDTKHITEQGTSELSKINLGKIFSFPKPIGVIEDCLKLGTKSDKNAIILDFFSGSATTAHAVMQLNAEDGGNRQFIMVQLPEKTDEKSEAFKAGYKDICEIGKERIRRAGKKIAEENPDKPFDSGFRVLKVADSNMTDVFYHPDEYSQDLLTQMESNIKPDRSDLDLLFGCLIDWGLPLSLPYHAEQIEGCTIHNYNNGDLIACFDNNVPESVVKILAKQQPLRAVFRDSSFADSPAKINVGEIFKLYAPNTGVKVI